VDDHRRRDELTTAHPRLVAAANLRNNQGRQP
jgi:hypothetical protein